MPDKYMNNQRAWLQVVGRHNVTFPRLTIDNIFYQEYWTDKPIMPEVDSSQNIAAPAGKPGRLVSDTDYGVGGFGGRLFSAPRRLSTAMRASLR